MRPLVIYLNELSCLCENPAFFGSTLRHVLTTLETLTAVKRIRPDLLIAGHASITGVLLGNGNESLATVLRGDVYKEEWRFISSLEQLSPWDAYPGAINPGCLEEVRFEDRTARGMTWARKNVSVRFTPS